MKDEIRRAFEGVTDEPHPALRASIRARLAGGPARPESRAWRFAGAAAVAAVLLAGVVGGGYLLLGRVAASPTASPTASPLAAFACSTSGAGSGSSMANVTYVRVGTAPGYDRLVFQFDGPVPAFTVTPQDNSTFSSDASGQVFQLQGSRGLRVVIHGASAMSTNGQQTYFGPNDLTPGYPALREARNIGDFERTYSWGLGVDGSGCFRAFILTGPDRLVIDVQQP